MATETLAASWLPAAVAQVPDLLGDSAPAAEANAQALEAQGQRARRGPGSPTDPSDPKQPAGGADPGPPRTADND